MGKLCMKCGADISEYDEICLNCGCFIGRTVNVIRPNKSVKIKRRIFGITFTIIFLSLLIVFVQLMSYYTNNAEKDVAKNEIKFVEDERKEIKEVVKKDEKKHEESKTEKKIQFTTYRDELRRFQIDYPDTIKKPEINQKRDEHSASQFREDISDKCVIFYGNFFKTIDKKIYIEKLMERARYDSFKDIKDIKMYKVSDIAYGYEYEKNGIHVIGKEYFGKVGKSGQSHYVQLRYATDVKEKDLLIGKRMFDSFKPGFENKGEKK